MTGFPDQPIDPAEYARNLAGIFRRWMGSQWTTEVVSSDDGHSAMVIYVNPRTGQRASITVEALDGDTLTLDIEPVGSGSN